MAYFDSGREIVDVGPVKVEKDVLEVVQALNQYDPNLEILMLKPGSSDFADAPYMIVENCPDGLKRKVFSCWELDSRVMERIYRADTRRRDVLSEIEKHNEQLKLNAMKRYRDSMDEARDIMEHVLAHRGSRYSFPAANGDTVTLDDTIGIIKRETK